MDTIVKKEFVKRILQDESARLEKSQSGAFRRYLTFHTGQTDSNRSYEVQSGDEMDGKLKITEQANVRFLDIRKGKKAVKGGRIASIKRRFLHNRPVFITYHAIARRLMFDLTDEVVAGIKRDFNIIK